MLNKIKRGYQDLKVKVVEAVQWAERELHGKTGDKKKKAVVKKLASLMALPWYLSWADEWIVGYLVDLAVEKFNWITEWNFSGVVIDNNKAAAVLEAPLLAEVPKDKTVDERLDEMYKLYGIEKEPSTPVGWDEAIQYVLKWEGGFVDHPLDKGGPTNRGVTLPVLKSAYAQGIVGHCDIKALTKDEAARIYRKNYWERYGWGELPVPVCIACLDISINHSPGGMSRIIQRACAKLGWSVDVDGKYGPKSKAALWALAQEEPRGLALAICDMKQDYYNRIISANPSQRVFLKGWTRRVADLRRVCAA